MQSKWRWTTWKSGTKVDKIKEASQGNSVDQILQKLSIENIPEPDYCSEKPLATVNRHGFELAVVNFITNTTLNDSRLIYFVLFEFLTFLGLYFRLF